MLVIKYTDEKLSRPLNEALGKEMTWVKPDGTAVDFETVVDVVEASLQDCAVYFPSIERVLKHKDILYTDDPAVPTMATDGISIFVNPAFVEWIIEEVGPIGVEYVLIHEALHVLFDHCHKHRESLDKYSDADKVNIAQDMEINFTIENFLRQGPGNTPFKGLTEQLKGQYNEEFGRKGMTWEEIYPKLPAIERKVVRQKMSDKWNQGFKDGYEAVMKDLRNKNLVEHHEIG